MFIVHECWSEAGFLTSFCFLFLRGSISCFKLNFSGTKVTSESCVVAPCAACELNLEESPQSHFSSSYFASDSASGNLRASWLLRLLNGSSYVWVFRLRNLQGVETSPRTVQWSHRETHSLVKILVNPGVTHME